MKQEIKFIYTLIHTKDDINVGTPRKVEITFDGQASLEELSEEFNAFVKAIGYNPPDNCVLDWVDVETGQPPEDDETSSSDDEVANISIKRKFKK